MDIPVCEDCESEMIWVIDEDIKGNECGEYICPNCKEFREEEWKDRLRMRREYNGSTI